MCKPLTALISAIRRDNAPVPPVSMNQCCHAEKIALQNALELRDGKLSTVDYRWPFQKRIILPNRQRRLYSVSYP